MKKENLLNVMGWRGINHSYALVNQFQLLALRNHPGVEIRHNDMPFASNLWSVASNSPGLNLIDIEWLMSIPQLQNQEECNWQYQIYSPVEYCPKNVKEKSLVFLVTELGVDPKEDRMFRLISAANDGSVHIATPSHWSRVCLEYAGFKPNSIVVIPHAASPDYFYPLEQTENEKNRRDLGILDTDIVIMNISSPFWNKGNDILLTAFAKALDKNPHLILIIKDQKDLYNIDGREFIYKILSDQKINAARIMNRIKFIQNNLNLQQLRTLYNLSDWYISSYRAEGFNLPVCESIACGTPVIVTDGGATDDFISAKAGIKISSKASEKINPNGKILLFREPELEHLIEILKTLERKKSIPTLAPIFSSWDFAARSIVDFFT